MKKNIPIVCDLDGTLIKSDLFLESLLIYIKSNFFLIFNLVYQLLFNKLIFKAFITHQFPVNGKKIPLNQELLDWLKLKKESGVDVFLVTGATKNSYESIKDRLMKFTAVYTSTNQLNLTGANKANFLIEKFGKEKFDYIGNSIVDFSIWKYSRKKLLANNIYLQVFCKKYFNKIFTKPALYINKLLSFLRIHQWTKNSLIFLHPIITIKQLSFNLFVNYCLFFLAFSLLASSIYVFNDIVDIFDDREHQYKHKRPLASGFFDLKESIIILLILLTSVVLLSFHLDENLKLIMMVYLLLNITYSFFLKKIKLIDVLFLSIFFNLRVLAGVIIDLNSLVSKRFLVFTGLIFLSLGFLKRFVELLNSPNRKLSGRGYDYTDKNFLFLLGLLSLLLSFGSILVSYPHLLILNQYSYVNFFVLVSLLYFWLAYLWWAGFIKKFHNDPVVFAATDKKSLLILVNIFILVMIS